MFNSMPARRRENINEFPLFRLCVSYTEPVQIICPFVRYIKVSYCTAHASLLGVHLVVGAGPSVPRCVHGHDNIHLLRRSRRSPKNYCSLDQLINDEKKILADVLIIFVVITLIFLCNNIVYFSLSYYFY